MCVSVGVRERESLRLCDSACKRERERLCMYMRVSA